MVTKEMKDLCLQEEENFRSEHSNKSKDRIKTTGEIFTPTVLVLELLEQLPKSMWEDGKTFLDPTCGNGQFLAAVAIVKRELGHKKILETIYGVDLMEDNVAETRQRLLAIVPDSKGIIEKNILCKNALEYDYSFGVSPLGSLFIQQLSFYHLQFYELNISEVQRFFQFVQLRNCN